MADSMSGQMGEPRVRRITIRRNGGNGCLQIFVLPLTIFGGLLLWGAVGTWLGIAQVASGDDRTSGVVQQVQCSGGGGIRGRGQSCSGEFTSDDGRVHITRVVVDGSGRRAGPTKATLVRKIDTGLVGDIQSKDTAYVGSVTISLIGPSILAVFLSIFGLALAFPALYLLGSSLWNRLRGSGP